MAVYLRSNRSADRPFCGRSANFRPGDLDETNTSVNKIESGEEAMATNSVLGIDHIGVTVPDIETATTFLIEALGAEVIYKSFEADQSPQGGAEMEHNLNLAKGTKLVSARMIKVGQGPTIEMFQLQVEDQSPAVRPSDFGMQHMAIYVEDIDSAVERFKKAGGKLFSEPKPFLFPKEVGDGNLFVYGQAPWGMMIEFITYPSKMGYQDETDLRLWHSDK
jgi:catechol 2,3-dioxygenase-like lactoylglutathione lyase family enzyme